MATEKRCPEVRKVDEEEAVELRKHYKALKDYPGFIRVGETGYLYPVLYEPEVEKIYNTKVKPTDIFIITFPRSGTTWTQEMVWLILNNLDYAEAASRFLVETYVELGSSIWTLKTEKSEDIEFTGVNQENRNKFTNFIIPGSAQLLTTPDPRFIKSHLPLSMLSPDTIDTAKVVYVARDPRDVAVSMYHLSRLFRMPQYTGDFKTFWNMFTHDNIVRSPYFPHVKEAWDLRNHPNMLFLFYEELKKDLPDIVKRTAKFFNKQYTDEQILKLCDHLDIDNFRKNESISANFVMNTDFVVAGEEPFIRKGKVGGWRDYFDEEMTKEADIWMAQKLKETGIQFPTLEK